LGARDGRAARLLALMADRSWHRADALEEAGGRRFGARRFDHQTKYGYPYLPWSCSIQEISLHAGTLRCSVGQKT